MELNGESSTNTSTLTPKYDWYQTDTYVVVTIMVKRVKQEEFSTKYGEQSLSVKIQRDTGESFVLNLSLSHKILPDKCTSRIMSTKIECKLMKAEGIRWSLLHGEDNSPTAPMPAPAASTNIDDANKYPSSAHYTRDWDKLVADIKTEEENEKPEGDEALNNFFKKIYSDGDENLRKAMNKSFSESGGTVLSTNWGDIRKEKTDVKAPDGMEFKKYEM
ncbi:protein SGT1 homolog [Styela clava]|uniref:protein SGT1 homolog n=1 Tax=Styela clava TaxID=7725 RepID=UPI00193A296D|nr:protein SGT1 homolog [Styela clava]